MSGFGTPETTRPVAIIGSGTPGRRIAPMSAGAGGEVRLCDPNAKRAEEGRRSVEHELRSVVAKRPAAPAGIVTVAKSLSAAVRDVWMAVVPGRIRRLDRATGEARTIPRGWPLTGIALAPAAALANR